MNTITDTIDRTRCAWCGSDDLVANLKYEGRGPWTPACADCADREADNGWEMAR